MFEFHGSKALEITDLYNCSVGRNQSLEAELTAKFPLSNRGEIIANPLFGFICDDLAELQILKSSFSPESAALLWPSKSD
jgi:hypothetical protein